MKITGFIFLTAVALVFRQSALGVSPPGHVIGWGSNIAGEATGVPSPGTYYSTGLVTIAGQRLTDAVAIAAGRSHSLALRSDGTVAGWGGNGRGEALGSGRQEPGGAGGTVQLGGAVLTNVVAISAGGNYSMALTRDGRAAAWGKGPGEGDDAGLALLLGLSNLVAIAAGWTYGIAANREGQLVCWGSRRAPDGLSNVVAVAAGGGFYAPTLALKSNGTVVQWSTGGLDSVPDEATNVMSLAAGEGHNLALRKDGTVVGWGSNRFGEATGVPTSAFPHYSSGVVVIAGQPLANVTAIAADTKFSLALKRDGTVVAWGYKGFHQTDVPAGLAGVVAIAAGDGFCLAITTNTAAWPAKR
jgi:alpha-tubulin suppressor-like RCC1 family protein